MSFTARLLSVAAMSVAAGLGATSAHAVQIFGLTTRDQLVRFDSASPGTIQSSLFISGLASNESLLGIDFRPANGMLYGIGSFGNLYTINTMTAQASFIAGLTNAMGGAPVAMSGVEFGVDFNPAADRLRVTSNQGQNLRINVANGVTFVDGALNGSSSFIVGSAYTNNDNDPMTGTTLYNIDSNSDMLTIQNPPNNGSQVNVGPLGMDTTALVGFDIYTSGGMNTAYASLQPNGTDGSMLYTINLMTGAASAVGTIGMNQTSDSFALRDLAVQPVPEPATMAALGAGLVALARRRTKRA